MSADFQNAFCIDIGIFSCFQNPFIACTLAFVYQASTNPPYKWMKPEGRFDGHVEYGSKIVATADVAQFVREDSLDVLWLQMLRNRAWPYKNGIAEAKNS